MSNLSLWCRERLNEPWHHECWSVSEEILWGVADGIRDGVPEAEFVVLPSDERPTLSALYGGTP